MKTSSFEDEAQVMREVNLLLESLDPMTCRRVVRWVDRKFRVDRQFTQTGDNSYHFNNVHTPQETDIDEVGGWKQY